MNLLEIQDNRIHGKLRNYTIIVKEHTDNKPERQKARGHRKGGYKKRKVSTENQSPIPPGEFFNV